MGLPRVGTVFNVSQEFELPVVSGSKAKMAHIDSDFRLMIVANGETGPLMMIQNPVYLGRPVSQFSDKLLLGMSFKELLQLKKKGLLR